MSKNLSGKCSQKNMDHAKKSPADTFKTLRKEQFKNRQKQMLI